MSRIGFDNELYLQTQSAHIRERLALQSLLDDPDFVTVSYLGLNLEPLEKYVCIVVRLNKRWSVVKNMTGSERLALSIEYDRICNEAVSRIPDSVAFKSRVSEYVAFLKCENTDYEQDVLEVSSRIQKDLLDQLGIESSIGISEPIQLENIRVAYDEACEAIEQRYYLAEDSSIAVTKYTEVQDQKAARELVEKQLPEAILSGEFTQLESLLNQTFAYIRSLSEEEQDNFMLFLLLPPRTLPGLKTKVDNPYRNQRQLVEHWLSCPSHVEQEQMLMQVMAVTSELLQDNKEPETSAIIRQIKSIIDEQYMEQISVASLAAQVHLTPTYLCVLFKQATGTTLKNYLIHKRIAAAHALIRQGSPAAAAAEQVGFGDYSAFFKAYKKIIGTSPADVHRTA